MFSMPDNTLIFVTQRTNSNVMPTFNSPSLPLFDKIQDMTKIKNSNANPNLLSERFGGTGQ